MKICLVGSILRHTIVTDRGEYSGWGGMTESAIAPFAVLLDKSSTIYFVGSVGKNDIKEIKEFYKKNYPIVNYSGIFVNPTGTDHHYGTKHFVRVKIKVKPTRYKHVEPFIKKADIVIFNFGNIDDIDPVAIKKTKQNSKAFVYVDVHRKPYGTDKKGYIYSRGWSGWEKYLKYADAVQINKKECEALFQRKIKNINDSMNCARKILDAGAGQAILTLGSEGVLLAYRTPSYEYMLMPAVPVQTVDTTGAGDAFAAGYLVALHEGKSIFEAAKLGVLVAAVNCEFMGYMKNVDRKIIEKKFPTNFSSLRLQLRNV